VELELVALTRKQVPANPFYAKLLDGQKQAYSAVRGGCTPELRAAPLSKGQHARGFVNFELSGAATGLKFVYAPRLADGSANDQVEFDLGR
jgi:hypothetical protein